MKLFGWLTGRSNENTGALARWQAAWRTAVENPDLSSIDALRTELQTARGDGGDVELELEMLDALERVHDMKQALATGSLPSLDTQHRVLGAEPCHFTAPASFGDEAEQTSGRVLATSTRLVFVGGSRTAATAWHAVHEVVRLERDVMLVRADHTAAAHYRFNTYGDAVLLAFLARHLRGARRTSIIPP